MNTVHSSLHLHPHSDLSPSDAADRFDWAGQIKLAIVLSVVAAMAATVFAGHIAEPVFIVGVIVVASVAGWARVQPGTQPVRVRRQ